MGGKKVKKIIIDGNSDKNYYGSRKAYHYGNKYDYTYYRIYKGIYILIGRKKGTHYYENSNT